jgi:hypothetical protein
MTPLRRLRSLLLPLLYVAAVASVAWSARVALDRVDGLSVARATPLVVAFGLLAVQVAVLAAVWALLLRAVGPEMRVSPALAVRSFTLGWLIRYVPGVPASSAGRYVLCREAGYPTASIAAALFYETLLQVGAGALVPAVTIGFALDLRWLWLSPLLVAAICAVTAAAVSPRAVTRLARRVRRAGMASADGFQPAPARALALPYAGAALGSFLAALAFHLIAVATTPLSGADLGLTLFAYGLAGWAGFLVPLLPSGVGVREAVLVALLGPSIGHADALMLAVTARALPVLFDACLGALLGLTVAGAALRTRMPLYRRT